MRRNLARRRSRLGRISTSRQCRAWRVVAGRCGRTSGSMLSTRPGDFEACCGVSCAEGQGRRLDHNPRVVVRPRPDESGGADWSLAHRRPTGPSPPVEGLVRPWHLIAGPSTPRRCRRSSSRRPTPTAAAPPLLTSHTSGWRGARVPARPGRPQLGAWPAWRNGKATSVAEEALDLRPSARVSHRPMRPQPLAGHRRVGHRLRQDTRSVGHRVVGVAARHRRVSLPGHGRDVRGGGAPTVAHLRRRKHSDHHRSGHHRSGGCQRRPRLGGGGGWLRAGPAAFPDAECRQCQKRRRRPCRRGCPGR